MPIDGVEAAALHDVGDLEDPVQRLPALVVGRHGGREAVGDDRVEPGAVAVTLGREGLGHGDPQVLVGLVQRLAGLAARAQSGGDHAVGDQGQRR